MNLWDKLQLKVVSKELAKTLISAWKEAGENVVFTNGCFDILHRGHITYLAKAASCGDRLIIGLNTDASVKRQGKGEERPINDETSRALVLAGLESVDLIVLFDDDTPLTIINELKPTILVKGADYDAAESDPNAKKYIVGSKEVKELGGEVFTIELEEGFSTTRIVERLKKS
jgi:rfaE bifunctional protein nucleotidyltransferase chain/domain